MKAALKTVGDRYSLAERQRLAVSRAAGADASLVRRRATCLDIDRVRGEHLIIDGFNLIVTAEAALSGGLLILCRDGCIRDMSSVHGSYRSVQETEVAIRLIGDALASLGPRSARWLLDRPVSNSGRLAQKIKETAEARGWPWSVEVIFNPDAEILASDHIAVTSDSVILDSAARWVNFTGHLIRQQLPQSWVIDLGAEPSLNQTL